MNTTQENLLLGKTERAFLLFSAIILAALLFFLRGKIDSQGPLDQLARKSIDPEIALANGRPTVFEFYADWCVACREMAPEMLSIENQVNKKIDIVLLNVDNKRWHDLIDKYEVLGIPQLNFFDSNGNELGASVGAKNIQQLNQLIDATIENRKIPLEVSFAKMSYLRGESNANFQKELANKNVNPRSHG